MVFIVLSLVWFMTRPREKQTPSTPVDSVT
jgi:hypothetical protein